MFLVKLIIPTYHIFWATECTFSLENVNSNSTLWTYGRCIQSYKTVQIFLHCSSMLKFAKVYRNRADERHFGPPLLKKMIHGCMQKNEAKNKQSCHTNVAKYIQPKEAGKVDSTPHKKRKRKKKKKKKKKEKKNQNFHVCNN